MHECMSNKWETLMWIDLSVQSSPCYIKLKSKLHQVSKKHKQNFTVNSTIHCRHISQQFQVLSSQLY